MAKAWKNSQPKLKPSTYSRAKSSANESVRIEAMAAPMMALMGMGMA